MAHEDAIIEQFRRAMAEKGIVVHGDIKADGEFHRVHVDGDKKGARNGWYVLHLDGKRPAGAFGCNKRYGQQGKFTWAGETRELTPEERREWRQRMERQRRERDAEKRQRREDAAHHAQFMWNQAQPCEGDDHPYLKRKGVKSHGLRVGAWEKIDRENGTVDTVSRQALLVPIRDAKKNIHSLQAIFAGKVYGDRDKDFVKDGAKEGLFYSVGKPQTIDVGGQQRMLIMIGEGYATVATAHEDTGHAGIVAFDAGNLLAVARALRKVFPDAVFLFLADNDRFTLKPVENPGVHHARAAAAEVGGIVAIPQFPADAPGKPTDFNDLRALRGADAVRATIEAALNPPAAPAEPEPTAEPLPWEDAPAGGPVALVVSNSVGPADAIGDPADGTLDGENPFVNNIHFRTLGVDGGTYYFFKKGKRNQILEFSTGGLTINALLSLAPLNWWEGQLLDGRDGKFKKDAAVDLLMQAAEQVGIFDPTFTRGRGAWWDDKRMVIHLGDRLLVDGGRCGLGDIKSEYLYQGGRRIAAPHDDHLSAEDGTRLLNVASMFRWQRQASAHLLCGWLMLSPLCGALNWRPHAWVTGGAGSGKSTIIDKFVRKLIPRGMELFANGDSSEAGLRQALRSDALPILIDESESDTELAKTKMQKILVMLRQSSSDTGAQTFRGTVSGEAQAFHVRSMALLSSIGVALEQQQDKERVIVLNLRSKREGEATDVENWPLIKAKLNELARDDTISTRLFGRSVKLAPVIMATIDVFTEAAAAHFGTAREGDQIGALMAGAWCMVHDAVPSREQALEYLRSFDWADYQEDKTEEQEDLVATLMGRIVQRPGGVRISLGKLVARSAGHEVDELKIKPSEADAELHNYGLKVKGVHLCVHPRNTELGRLMRDTKFAADLRGRLKRIPGAETSSGGIRIGEVSTSGVLVPLKEVLRHRTDPPTWVEPSDQPEAAF